VTVLRNGKAPRWDERDASSEHFVGGISPLWMFDYQLQGLFSVVELARVRSREQPHLYEDVLRRAAEVALIGAVGYFEAFCKHQFAALLTLHAPLLVNFANRRQDASLRLSALASAAGELDLKIGFLIAESYDFGSAKQVNGLFRDLLECSPLPKDEGDELDAILRKRHLIVHHGGIVTAESARAKAQVLPSGQAFRDVVGVDPDEYCDIEDFLRLSAAKVAVSTVQGLKRRTRDLSDLAVDRRPAVELLLRAVWDQLDA
jgi:hypothetical protein